MKLYIIFRIITGIFGAIRNMFVGIINIFIETYNKEKRKQIDYINRGVIERKNSSIEDLLNQDSEVKNTVISGKSTHCRNEFITKIAKKSRSIGIPVILIHENNLDIEASILQEVGDDVIVISEQNPIYDPFYHLKHSDITELMCNTASNQYDIQKESFESYVEVMCDYLLCQKKQITFDNMCSFPHMTFVDDIDTFVESGRITQSQANVLKTKITMGQSEKNKVISLLNNWYKQCKNIINKKI